MYSDIKHIHQIVHLLLTSHTIHGLQTRTCSVLIRRHNFSQFMESFIKMTQDNLVISQNVIIHPGFSSAMLSIKFKICV